MTMDPHAVYRIVCPSGNWTLTNAKYAVMDRDRADYQHDSCRDEGTHLIQSAQWTTVTEEEVYA